MNQPSSTTSQPLKRQDRTLFCKRCGISFLWISEEQGAPETTSNASRLDSRTVRPSLCPACRLLVAPVGRERGLVKWYNRRKRFGFITRKGQPDLFVHGSAIQGRGALQPDQLVEFNVDENDQGLIATQVVRLHEGVPGTLGAPEAETPSNEPADSEPANLKPTEARPEASTPPDTNQPAQDDLSREGGEH